MESMQIIALSIFVATVFMVVVRWIDSVVAAMVGVVLMVMLGVMTEEQAFGFVDWNVIAILVSIWLLAGYFGKTGIPEYLGEMTLSLSKGNVPLFVTLIGGLSGFISMFIDNVVVVLMLAPVVFHIARCTTSKPPARFCLLACVRISWVRRCCWGICRHRCCTA